MSSLRVFGGLLVVILYFLPTIICEIRLARRGLVIFLVNAFLGWTVVGWIAALTWAILEEREQWF